MTIIKVVRRKAAYPTNKTIHYPLSSVSIIRYGVIAKILVACELQFVAALYASTITSPALAGTSIRRVAWVPLSATFPNVGGFSARTVIKARLLQL